MKVLILTGGYGTRLRPLTFTQPKPLVDFMNMPILEHQLIALSRTGLIKEVILAVNKKTSKLLSKHIIEEYKQKYHIRIHKSIEMEPLGTLGPIKLAQDLLVSENIHESFFVINSDIIVGGQNGEDVYPLQQMMDFHKLHGGKATILTTKVKDPSKYGEIVAQADGKITSIVEKPSYFVSNQVNAGIYLLSSDIFEHIGLNLENIVNDLFYSLQAKGKLYAYAIEKECYWMDIGNPRDYLTAQKMVLDHMPQKQNGKLLDKDETEFKEVILNPETQGSLQQQDIVLNNLEQLNLLVKQNYSQQDSNQLQQATSKQQAKQLQSPTIIQPVLIDESALIHPSCTIGPYVVIGARTYIGPGCNIRDSTVMSDCNIKGYTLIKDSVIGWKNSIGQWCRISDMSVTGEDVNIAPETMLEKHYVMPHVNVNKVKVEALEKPDFQFKVIMM